ncbi:MAG: heterodisulfide reductase [Desulfobacteraceae bacterium]|nr:MAG: heterodisulfide reductase [Desulfobacteraceae bacterium]
MSQQEYAGRKHETSDPLFEIRKMVNACIQCGTCTGSCPNAFGMDFTPRHLWRLVLTGQKDEIFKSRSFGLCSACYYCTLRCPRGLPLTEAMSALKQIAASEKADVFKTGLCFYGNFLESVRKHGRVWELEFMSMYFISIKNPLIPLRYTSLGLRLFSKGKLSVRPHAAGRTMSLEKLFLKTKEVEQTIR